MKNKKPVNSFLVILLIITLMVPSTVLALDKNVRIKPEITKYQEGQVIIKTNGSRAEETRLLKKYQLRILRRDLRLGHLLAAAPTGTDIGRLVADLKRNRGVLYAQPNYTYKLWSVPNDPQYYRQWAMKSINAERGWDVIRSGAGVIVAVLDTGVDAKHPDLRGKLVAGVNTINPLKSARDNEGHGTHVAGIIGASSNNGLGVAGVTGSAGIKIMPVKVFDEWGGTDISISDGIIWAADHGAKVINMSFGSEYRSEILNEAIDYAYDKGVVLVAAAGNWASEDLSYPAAISKVISVSALDRENNLARFSSYGPLIDVSAPGEKIYSTVWDPHKGSTYTEMSGTSMASPMVAGLAALLLNKDPDLTNDEIRQIIEASASDLGDPGWDPRFGHGKIDIYRALNLSLENIDDDNGSMDKALALDDGIPSAGIINFGSDEDWYRISVPGGSHLQVEVLPAGKVSPGVEIYDANGEKISSFNTGETRGPRNGYTGSGSGPWNNRMPAVSLKVAESVYGLVTGLGDGDYYIKVFGNHFRWSEESYNVTARVLIAGELVTDHNEPNDSYEESRSISLGKPVQGAILADGDEDWFKIDLPGKAYRIQLKVPDGLDLAVEIENSENYREVSIGEYSDFYNKWFYEEINYGGQGVDEETVIVLPEQALGPYYLRVYEVGGGSVNAGYTLSVSDYNFTPDRFEDNNTFQRAALLENGEEIQAGFHRRDDVDWFKFEVKSAGIIRMDFREPPNSWCSLGIYSDPKEEPIGYAYFGLDSSWPGEGQDYLETKVSPGTYYINVNNWGRISADRYSLKISFRNHYFVDRETNDTPLTAETIALGATKQGTLYPDGDEDYYILEVEKPQPYLVYLTPPAGMDTAVIVLKEIDPASDDQGEDPDPGEPEVLDGQPGAGGEGTETGNSDSTAEPYLIPVLEINNGSKGQTDTGVFVPAKPGEYYIVVYSWEGKSTGLYSLTVNPFRSQPDAWEDNDTMASAKALAGGVTVEPTFMGIEDRDWFKVYVPGKGVLGINLSVPNDIDGVFEVYDPAGKLLGKIDHSMVGIEEIATFNVSKSGYYFIKTYDYLGNSSVLPYSLTARYLETIPPKVSRVKVTGGKVSFYVSEPARVFVKVLNSKGVFVDMILDGKQVQKGNVSSIWDAKDAMGRDVFPGIYRIKIVAIDASGNKSKPVYTSIKV